MTDKIRAELDAYKLNFGLLEKKACSDEDNKKYMKMLKRMRSLSSATFCGATLRGSTPPTAMCSSRTRHARSLPIPATSRRRKTP